MTEAFDPYRKWLGIPPSQQPPHHYRLLGIELFESDLEVIDTAAGQRMSYLQELAGGQYVKESQRLLNEVSSARRCLLDAKKKNEYDAELKKKLAPAEPAAPTQTLPKAKLQAKAAASAAADDETITLNLSEATAKLKHRTTTSKSTEATAKTEAKSSDEKKPAKRKKKSSISPATILVMTAVVVAGLGAFILRDKFLPRDSADYETDEAGGAAAAVSYTQTDPVEPERAIPPRERKPFGAAPIPTPTPTGTAAATPSATPSGTAVAVDPAAANTFFATNLQPKATATPSGTAAPSTSRSRAPAPPPPAGSAVKESMDLFTPKEGLPVLSKPKPTASGTAAKPAAAPSGTAKPSAAPVPTPTAKPATTPAATPSAAPAAKP